MESHPFWIPRILGEFAGGRLLRPHATCQNDVRRQGIRINHLLRLVAESSTGSELLGAAKNMLILPRQKHSQFCLVDLHCERFPKLALDVSIERVPGLSYGVERDAFGPHTRAYRTNLTRCSFAIGQIDMFRDFVFRDMIGPRFCVCGVAGRDFAEAGSGGVGWSVCRAGVSHFRKEHPQPARPPWTGRLGGWPSPSRRGCPESISHSRQRWPRSCPDTLVVVPACRRDRCRPRPRRRRRRRSPPHCLRHPLIGRIDVATLLRVSTRA